MQEELLQFKLQKGYTQEEGIDYDEVFAPVTRIEAIRLFLAYDSFMGYMVYQIDVKSAFFYGRIEEEPLVKDADGVDVDVHLYISIIGSLMYLTTSRPDIIDYTGASLDRKSTTRGCQFLGRRLISWKYKKQTMVATSTTEAEYMAAASYRGQVKQSSMAGFGEMITTVL
uniref:Reverse transcriptase Ty1/copia-type domain-containing protein n=1 Tax=Tanacetum cinerariifolium TaxID=118510 RepID=A0A699J8V0_TANCI|nr:hypothetical protein [Tanacetum cinerariifolium]